jgi:hypothetical protein
VASSVSPEQVASRSVAPRSLPVTPKPPSIEGTEAATADAMSSLEETVPRKLGDDIDIRALGIGAHPSRRDLIRNVGAAVGLCALFGFTAFLWFGLPLTERATPPELAAATASSPPAAAPRPSLAPSPPVVAIAPSPPMPPAIVESPTLPAPLVVAVTANRPGPHAAAAESAPTARPAPPPSSAGARALLAPGPPPLAAPAPTAPPSASSAASEPAGGDGFLNINSLPASLIVLDGKPIGSTPKVRLQVTAGAHTVVFTNSELGVMKEVSVTIGAGETKVATAKLRE